MLIAKKSSLFIELLCGGLNNLYLKFMKLKHLILFLAAYVALFFLLFPSYQYLIDPDATGYISVAERLSRGDYFNAINGMWSPLGSWILSPFIKSGFDAVITEKYLNGVYGFIILCSFFYLIKKMRISFVIEVGILIAGITLIVHFVFFRLFGDLLQAMFLLLYLNVICSKSFYGNYLMIVLAAFLGGLGFYAKVYSFYFTVAHLVIVLIVFEKKISNKYFNVGVLKKILAGISTLIIIVLPWVFILKHKYGSLILSCTGAYNMTWSLSAVYPQPRVLFYPPPYSDGYSIWDDPSFWHVTNITPFTSSKTFLFQLKLIGSNFLELIKNLNIYSCFLISILLIIFLSLFTKIREKTNNINNIILISFLLIWPLGILLLHVEARFLWIMVMVALLLGGVILTYLETRRYFSKKIFLILVFIVISSFSIYPLKELKEEVNKGKNISNMANALKKNNIGGNLISYHQNSGERDASVVLNYLLKGKYFGPHENDYTTPEILSGIEEYKIDNYILFYHSQYQKQQIIKGEIARYADSIYVDLYPGIVVLTFRHN